MSIKKISGYKIFLTEKLGKGAYGTVYRGESTNEYKTSCAVKILDKSSIDADPYLKAALISEIKIMKAVHSENIVQLYDVMESTNNYYIIQELCDGDLEHYLKSKPGGLLEEVEAVRVLREVCNGFLTLVKEGIVHRDLKPANVFLAKGSCKIGDFGFAKKNQTGLKNQSAVGTPLYMSIEILKGEPYTSKCDIWALGLIFYEMLHGRLPWTARSQFELIKNIEAKALKISEQASPLVADFLSKCLKIHEEDRISWDALYKHPIFGHFFNKEIESNQHLENVFKKVMADIRFQVNSKNLNLKKIWTSLGYGIDKELDEAEFRQFVRCVVPNMAPAEEDYFFHQMDVNKDRQVSLSELEVQFHKHNIPLTSQFEQKIPFLLKKMVTIEEDPEDAPSSEGILKPSSELEKKIHNAFLKLEHTLDKKKLTLYQVFNAYDGDKNGQLDLKEFSKIMKRLDPGFSEEEIESIFFLVDTDQSKTVEFDEMNSYFCKITGLPESLHAPPGYYSKKK